MINEDLENAVKVLEDGLINPAEGLSPSLFRLVSRVTPLVNVDLLIQDKHLGTLLTWRARGNYAPGWHVPGGIIRVKETFDQRLEKVAMLELGVRVKYDSQPVAISEMIHPDAETRVHFVSFLYRTTLCEMPDPNLKYRTEDPQPGHWQWHIQTPVNLYEPQKVYRKYIDDYMVDN